MSYIPTKKKKKKKAEKKNKKKEEDEEEEISYLLVQLQMLSKGESDALATAATYSLLFPSPSPSSGVKALHFAQWNSIFLQLILINRLSGAG